MKKLFLPIALLLPLSVMAAKFDFSTTSYYTEAMSGTPMGHEKVDTVVVNMGGERHVSVNYSTSDESLEPQRYTKVYGFNDNGSLLYKNEGRASVGLSTPPTQAGLALACSTYFSLMFSNDLSLRAEYLDVIKGHPNVSSVTGQRCLLIDELTKDLNVFVDDTPISLEGRLRLEIFATKHSDPISMLILAMEYRGDGNKKDMKHWADLAARYEGNLSSGYEKRIFIGMATELARTK